MSTKGIAVVPDENTYENLERCGVQIRRRARLLGVPSCVRWYLYVLCVAQCFGALTSFALDFDLLWTAEAHMVMEGAPMTADLNGDGDAEIVTAAYENLIAFDGDGSELWRFDTRGRYQTCPAIWEREGETPLVYAGDNTGQFTCVDGLGKIVWQADMKPIFCASPAIGDLDGDGAMEVVQGNKSGMVTAFDALTGKVKWQARLEGECASATLADLNGDEEIETIISSGAGKVYAIDAAGKVLWTFAMDGTTPDWATCSPVVVRDGGNTPHIVCAAGGQQIYCIEAGGTLRWNRTTNGAIASSLSAGELDGDNDQDIFAVTQLGVLYRFDLNGRTIWTIDTQGRSLAPGAIIDIDGDGALEYLLCTQNGNMLAFNRSGNLIYSRQFDNRTINVTPAFGDILSDRPGLEFAVTGGESGKVYCFGTQSPVDAPWDWRAYRRASTNAGEWTRRDAKPSVEMVPATRYFDRCGPPLRVDAYVKDPPDGILTAEATCTGADGAQWRALSRFVGPRGVVELPMNGIPKGQYTLRLSLRDANGKELYREAHNISLERFEADQQYVKVACESIRRAVGEPKPDDAGKTLRAAVWAEVENIEKEAKALDADQDNAAITSGASYNEVVKRTEALNARCKQAIEVAKLADVTPNGAYDAILLAVFRQARRSPSDEDSIPEFVGTNWDNRLRDFNTSEPMQIGSDLAVRCVTGEHVPVSVTLVNASNITMRPTIRIATESDDISAAAFIPSPVPTNFGEMAWDALIPLADVHVEIRPLEMREVWVDVDLSRASAGKHRLRLIADYENGSTNQLIDLNVLPFAMAEYDRMRMCTWAQYNEHAVRDLLAHGNTVFIGSLPPATVAAGATPAITCDFVALDEFLAPLKGHDVYLLFHGIPQLGAPMESEEYVPRFAEYMKRFFEHLAANGFDDRHVALYPYDEPGGNGWNVVKQYTAFARQALKAHAGLTFYVNGGADLGMFEEMAEYAGVWSPSFYMLPYDTPEMTVLRNSRKTLWSYDCAYAFSRPVGANTKTVNIVAQYRLSAIVAMNYGATGIGWWCYNHGPSMWGPIQYEYPLVYTNEDGTVTTSRRWEAVREGVEDSRILIALRDKLVDDSVSAEAKGKIRTLLGKTVPELSHQTMEEARLGVARYAIDASHNDETVERLRTEMMDCVEALGKR